MAQEERAIETTDFSPEGLRSKKLGCKRCIRREEEDIAGRPRLRLGQGAIGHSQRCWVGDWPQAKDNLQNVGNPEARNLRYLAMPCPECD